MVSKLQPKSVNIYIYVYVYIFFITYRRWSGKGIIIGRAVNAACYRFVSPSIDLNDFNHCLKMIWSVDGENGRKINLLNSFEYVPTSWTVR